MFNLTSSREKDKSDGDLTVPLDGTNGSGPLSDSGNPIGVGNTGKGAQCPNHQLALETGDSTAGTITVLARAVGKLTPEPVQVETTPGVFIDLVINLGDAGEPFTRDIVNNSLVEFIFQLAGLDGSGNITATVVSGDGG